MWSPRRVSAAGDGRIPKTSLIFARIALSLAGNDIKRRGRRATRKSCRPENGLRARARWVMSEGLLARFSLAKKEIDRLEGRVKDDDDKGAPEQNRGVGREFATE